MLPPSAGGTQAPLHLRLCVPALLALTPSPRGNPRCWGYNWPSGQLGLGSTAWAIGVSAGEVVSLADVDLGAGRTVVQLAAGWSHTCALLDDGKLYAPRPLSRPWMGCFSLA